MEYKISMVIPIFNAGQFLDNLINSLINQTFGFENIELILVDDCSSDNSRDIIKSYADKYDNIKPIFLEENSGAASYPRNVGISHATAPYMQFLDADDDVDKDYCYVLYDLITSNDVDIVNCNHSSKLNNQLYISKDIETINFKADFVDENNKMLVGYTAWGNIYKSSLIMENDIRFPSTQFDDGVFSLTCLAATSKPVIQVKDYPGYVYLIENEDSITHKASFKTISGFIEAYYICYDILKKFPKVIIEENLINFVDMAIFILVKFDNPSEGIKLLADFENHVEEDIVLKSKPLNVLNNMIKNRKYGQASFIVRLFALFYNNKRIRNFVFVKFSNLKLK